MKRFLGFALFAGAAVLILPTCRTTRHTVARIVTPVAAPTEVFVPAEPAPTSPPVTRPATVAARTAAPAASPTPTIAPMRVVTAPPAASQDRAPGVLYEQYVPTVVVTPVTTPISTRAATPRSTRPPRTPTPAATQKPGVYYEDPEGRPLTPTPQS